MGRLGLRGILLELLGFWDITVGDFWDRAFAFRVLLLTG